DEYGNSSIVGITNYAAEYQIAVDSIQYTPYTPNLFNNAAYAKQVLQTADTKLVDVARKPEDWIVLIADTGLMLKETAANIRKRIPRVRIGTLSSPDQDEVATGDFDGMYL